MPHEAPKVYIHELIEISGHNRARYMHHMTANWCPVARRERNQLCLGVWATVGSTGRWPEVVNMWELGGWDGLVANFEHELAEGRDQDPSLAEWWAVAAGLRRGGVDRIVVAEPGTRPVDDLVAAGVRGALYAHDLVTVPPGRIGDYLGALAATGMSAVEETGLEMVGAYRVAMVNETEAVVLWAIPDWPTWADFEQAWADGGRLERWRRDATAMGADWRRHLMVDSPLNPMRTGRQPQEEDRRPLEEIG